MRLQVIIYHLQSTLQIFHCWIWLGVFLLMCNVSAIKSQSREETAWNFGAREQTARIIFSDLYLCCDFVCLFSSKLNTKTVKKKKKQPKKHWMQYAIEYFTERTWGRTIIPVLYGLWLCKLQKFMFTLFISGGAEPSLQKPECLSCEITPLSGKCSVKVL